MSVGNGWVVLTAIYSDFIMRRVLVLRSTLCCRLVMGWLKFREAGRKFDCLSSLNTVRLKHLDYVGIRKYNSANDLI